MRKDQIRKTTRRGIVWIDSKRAARYRAIDTGVAGAFAVLFLLLSINVILTLRNNHAIVTRYNAEVAERSALRQLEKLLSLLDDAETGQRGYLLAQNNAFLTPYNAALPQIPHQLELVGDALAGDATSTSEFGTMRELVSQKLDELARTIQLETSGGHVAALDLVASARGKNYMDQIRRLADSIAKRKESALEIRTHQVASEARSITFNTWLSGAISLAILALLYYLIHRLLVQQRGLEAERAMREAELERRVALRTAELQHTNQELEAFTYSVSHDLRAPLRSISGFSALLESDLGPRLNDEERGMLTRIKAASARMGVLIDDLLRLSRVGRYDVVRETIDISALFTATLENLKQQAPREDLSIVVDEGMVAMADRRTVPILAENLLSNAWKFTSRTDGAKIHVGHTRTNGVDAFFVHDNGPGFEMQYAHKIFEPFQRLHPDDQFEGTGIGLAIVARIIRQHGGIVHAESKPGEGATISFTLGPSSSQVPT